MSEIEKKILEMGLELPVCPVPVAQYVPAVTVENLVFVSGQTPIVDGKLLYKGKIGHDLTTQDGYEAAKYAALRVVAGLKSAVGDLDRVERIVKVTGYVNSDAEYLDHPKVVNGASDLIRNVFGVKGEHSRVAFGVASLPDGAAVEIDLIAYIK